MELLASLCFTYQQLYILFDRNNGKGVVPDQEGAKQVDVATKDKVRGTPNPGLGLKVETPHSTLQYPSMDSKIRK